MVRHYLKTWPEFFEAILSNTKPFEIRKDDRNFASGDILHLREYDPATKEYSGREVVRTVTYLLGHRTDAGCAATFGLQPGYVIMGIADSGVAQGAPIPEGFMLLPIEATAMMALRGYQTTGVFEKNDYFGDYIDAAELPAALAPTHKFDDDERGWMLAAAAYRGCVSGYIETLRRLEKDPTDAIALGWNKPMNSAVTSTHDQPIEKTEGGAS